MSEKIINVIGVTGPTGSGKGEVSNILKENGYEIIDADSLASGVINQDEVISKIINEFGKDLLVNGRISRRKLASRAFKNLENEKKLNSIVHPAVLDKARKIIQDCIFNEKNNIVFDAPLLFESNGDSLCTTVISVIASKEERLKRIMKRDGITKREALKRMSVQQDDNYYIDRSEYVIYNDGDMNQLKEQVIKFLDEV